MREDKPLVSRRVAILASIILIFALFVMLYFLFGGMRAGVANPFQQPKQPPKEESWELSPLVGQYSIGTTTPVLVVNCRYVFTGSDARGEQKGIYPEGTERENIGEAICRATNDSFFCSRFRGMPKYFTGERDFPLCKRGNKTLIYAFHNPLCPICAAQREVLDAFRNEFSSQIVLEYVCVPTSEQGRDACSKEFLVGKYNK